MVYVGSSWTELDYWTSPTGYGDYDARLRIMAYSTQDIAANTSKVYFKIQKRVTGGSAYNYDNLDVRITGTGAGGDGHTATQTWNFGSVSSTSWTDVGGDTSDMYWSGVKHNDNGSLSLTCNMSGDRILGGTFSGSVTIELPTIARASVPSATPNPLTIDSSGKTLTINTNRKSSSFNHTIKVQCGNWSWTSSARAVGASTTVTVPYSVVAQFSATSKTATATITCTTFSGTTQIGSAKTATVTFQVDTSVDYPAVTSITTEDLNDYTSAIEAEGSLIKNASYLKATIALNAYGSYTELKSAVVTCGTVTQSYALTGTAQTITFLLDKVSVNMLTVTVADKRGTTAVLSKSWNLVNYTDLTVIGSVDRTSETGNTIALKLTGQCFAGSFGQVANQITVKYKSKLHSASDYPSTWTTVGTFTPSGEGATTYEYTNTLTGFDYDKQYDLIFYVEDLFTNAQTADIVLTTGVPVYGNSSDFFAVYGNLHIHDREDPSQFWTLSPSDNIHTDITEVSESVTTLGNSLAMHGYSWSGSFSNSSSASRTLQITGAGIVMINIYVRNNGADDTGQCDATIYLWNTSNANQGLLASSGNRISASSTHQFSANAATQYYYDGSSANRRLRCNVSCTKNGTNSWRIQVTTIGCTLASI